MKSELNINGAIEGTIDDGNIDTTVIQDARQIRSQENLVKASLPT